MAGNILVITYWSYRDALIQTYTLPYVRLIKRQLPAQSEIYLVTLEQSQLRLSEADARRAREELKQEGIHLIAFNYSSFGFAAIIKWMFFLARLLWLCLQKRITHIHAWCTPAGGAGYILSLLSGIPLVIDSYEPHAESMAENGTWSRRSAAFKILLLLEKLQSRRAKAVIATTQGMMRYARERYNATFREFYVKPACVDLQLFSPLTGTKNAALRKQYNLADKLVCVYAGKMGGIYLEAEIFDFFKAASDYWGDKFRVLLLTNADEAKIKELAMRSSLDPEIIVTKFVEHADVPQYLALGDFALNPVKPVPTKRFCTSIKDGEYWAMGLPVVIPPNISDDSDIIKEQRIGAIIEEFNPEAYLKAIREIDLILQSCSRRELIERVRKVAIRYRNFADAEAIYRKIYGASIK